jgi:hypothetical protein
MNTKYAVAGIHLNQTRTNKRTIDPWTHVDKTVAKAKICKGGWSAVTHNGGSVGNSYNYRAYTEGCVVIADKRGRFTIYASGGMNAHNISTSSVVRNLLGADVARLWKANVTNPKTKNRARFALLRIHLENVKAGNYYTVVNGDYVPATLPAA